MQAEHETWPGRFLADSFAYEINTPDTPATWFNYLFNDTYYTRISQTGQGSSWLRTPVIQAYTRGFRYVYVQDLDSGVVWCPTTMPLRNPDATYRCVHDLSHTTFDSTCHGIQATLRAFVPATGQREVWSLMLTNTDTATRSIAVYGVFSFDSVAHMGQICRYEPAHRVITRYAFPHHAEYGDYEHLKDRPLSSCLWTNRAPDSFDCGEAEFFGAEDHSRIPAAVQNEQCSNQARCLSTPIGVFQHRLQLEPGTSTSVHYVCGAAQEAASFAAACAPFMTDAGVQEALHEVEEGYRQFNARIEIQTPDPDLDRFVNAYWKKEILWETRLWRNGVSTPWRNELQDAMGYALVDPEAAWPYLKTVASIQEPDGYLKVWNTREGHASNHPLTKKRHTDGGIWLAICLTAWSNQTGCASSLDRLIPFADGAEGTVYEHICRAIEFTGADCGAHGLVRMHDGDWTDPINGPGRGGKGESVWASMALLYAIEQARPLCQARKDEERLTSMDRLATSIKEAIETHAWTGSWYAYGFDDSGRRFGTPEDEEGKLYLNTQAWALISGVAQGDRRDACLAAIQELQTPAGPLLLTPAFTKWDPTVGRLSLKIPGTTENGSIYCHGASFLALGYLLHQDAEAGYDTLRRILPTNPDNPPSRNRQIPIFQANGYFGERTSSEFGRSSQTLGTGTCTWALYAAVEYLLGVQPTLDGIRIQPCLPESWSAATVKRTLHACTYTVTIQRNPALPRGHIQIKRLNGNEVTLGNVVPWQETESCTLEVDVG